MTEVERICLAALDRPAEERAAFLEDACHGDEALRHDIELLLAHASAAEDADFRRRFDLMALQRNLKALGTFGFQTTSRGNPVYIQYIPRTLSYARANLAKYERFSRLRELLAEHLEELR